MMRKIMLAQIVFLLCSSLGLAEGWQTRALLPTPRGYVPSVELNGKIYVIGGDVSGGGVFSGVNEVYDPENNSWTTLAPMPTARALHSLAAVNGKIYAIGGYNNYLLTVNQEYDPENNSWTTKAPMPTARYGAGATVVGGKIYILGGHPGYGFLNTNQVYDPVNNSWETKAPMPTARAYLGAAAVNGKIYAVGGAAGPIPGWYNTDVNEEYNPLTDSWVTRAPMPTARQSLAVVEANNRIYAIGGWLGGLSSVLTVNEEYNPMSNSWVTRAQMPTPRTSAGAAVGNKIYIIGGFGYSGPLAVNEEYTADNPAATITLTPLSPPIQIPASGGSFDFNATITNSGGTPTLVNVWIMVQLPNTSWYGPVLGPLSLIPPGGVSLTRLRSQNVPASAPPGNYWYEARLGDYPGAVWDTSGFAFTKLGFGIRDSGFSEWSCTGEPFPGENIIASEIYPSSFILYPSAPNPFNASTDIRYQLPAASHVSLKVYDTAGRLVATLRDGWRDAGTDAVTFDGSKLASGIYLARLETEGFTSIQKLVLIK